MGTDEDVVTISMPRNLINLLRVHFSTTADQFQDMCCEQYEMTGAEAGEAGDRIEFALIPPPAKLPGEAAIYQVPTSPTTWAVEGVDHGEDGEHMAFFCGPDAEARAVAYAGRSFCKTVRLNHAPSR